MKLVGFGALAATKGTVAMREEGIVAAALGTTALSANDRYWQ